MGEPAYVLNSGGEAEISGTRKGTVWEGTSETLREAGYTPSSPTGVRLRELRSLAQGHRNCAVAFTSSEGPQGRALEEPVGAASMVIQVQWLISN